MLLQYQRSIVLWLKAVVKLQTPEMMSETVDYGKRVIKTD